VEGFIAASQLFSATLIMSLPISVTIGRHIEKFAAVFGS